MGMVIGTTLAAIALAVFGHSVLPQYTFAMRAGTGWIWHDQTPFFGRPGAANAGTFSSDCGPLPLVQRR
jgi:hypothetical protein